MKKQITIIGTGLSLEDIPAGSLLLIKQADTLIAGKRLLAYFLDFKGGKIEITRDAALLVKGLKSKLRGKSAVVLASGDPNFFGIASLFYKHFPKERIEVLPNITAFQAAFARIKEPWDNAVFISVHGRNLNALNRILRDCGTFVLYCDNENTPAKVAEYLIDRAGDMATCSAWVFQNLGAASEKVIRGKLGNLKHLRTASLSMMIIKTEHALDKLSAGIPDNLFIHQKGLITKRDVRLIAVSRLSLKNGQVLWDIGAGSGSVSIEAANMYPELEIYAIEKDEKRYKELLKNISKFKTIGLEPVFAQAPDVLKDLPDPDTVFIGGTGGELQAILVFVKKRIRAGGHVVVNCVTMETLSMVLALFKKWKWKYEVVSAQHAYMTSDKKPEIFRAENQVFIVSGFKNISPKN